MGFMGIVLEAGHNEIEFVYTTPGLKAGALVSLAGCVLWVLYVFIGRKKKTDDCREMSAHEETTRPVSEDMAVETGEESPEGPMLTDPWATTSAETTSAESVVKKDVDIIDYFESIFETEPEEEQTDTEEVTE